MKLAQELRARNSASDASRGDKSKRGREIARREKAAFNIRDKYKENITNSRAYKNVEAAAPAEGDYGLKPKAYARKFYNYTTGYKVFAAG